MAWRTGCLAADPGAWHIVTDHDHLIICSPFILDVKDVGYVIVRILILPLFNKTR
jgi:hypothetical protein